MKCEHCANAATVVNEDGIKYEHCIICGHRKYISCYATAVVSHVNRPQQASSPVREARRATHLETLRAVKLPKEKYFPIRKLAERLGISRCILRYWTHNGCKCDIRGKNRVLIRIQDMIDYWEGRWK